MRIYVKPVKPVPIPDAFIPGPIRRHKRMPEGGMYVELDGPTGSYWRTMLYRGLVKEAKDPALAEKSKSKKEA